VHRLALVLAILLIGVAAVPLGGACSSSPEGETATLTVVTSTSLIASIVERVGGDLVEVVNIIPPAQCPGHFDVSPTDVQKLADAPLFLYHGWQGETFAADLIASADNPDLTSVSLDIAGNWMTPDVQIEAAAAITNHLCQVDPVNCPTYQQRSEQYANAVLAKGSEIQQALDSANLSEINVLCAEMQVGFVRWTGLNVIDTYPRPDALTAQMSAHLVDLGKAENVTLVIDNLQSGADGGKAIAEDIGCARIVLSNFPGGFDNTETWEKAIDHNIDLILEAVTK